MRGAGFKTADVIAAAVGIAAGGPERIKAGLACTLSGAAGDGHCYLPAPSLTGGAAEILGVPAELITPCLEELAAAEGVARETVPAPAAAAPRVPAVYLPPFYQAERSVAHALLRLRAARAAGWRRSPRPTGARRWPGCRGGPGHGSPRNRPPRCGWP